MLTRSTFGRGSDESWRLRLGPWPSAEELAAVEELAAAHKWVLGDVFTKQELAQHGTRVDAAVCAVLQRRVPVASQPAAICCIYCNMVDLQALCSHMQPYAAICSPCAAKCCPCAA